LTRHREPTDPREAARADDGLHKAFQEAPAHDSGLPLNVRFALGKRHRRTPSPCQLSANFCPEQVRQIRTSISAAPRRSEGCLSMGLAYLGRAASITMYIATYRCRRRSASRRQTRRRIWR
jgi:hypothetical protein